MASVLAPRPRLDRSFERLYRRHVADVYHFSLAILRNPSDAEDVTQTTFLNAYSAYRRGERPKAPRNWLIAIAHNVCRQRFRQSARRPQEVALEDDVGEALVEDVPSAHDIRTALGYLAFNQRAALVMRELEGRSYAEIAEILGVSVGAVETLIFRARRALREQLDGALTCREAELAVSRQLDGRLPRSERGALRAHLRACPECATFARRQRAQRAALRSIAAIPLPASLASFFGGGGGAVGVGVAAKAATAVAVGVLVGGAGYEGVKRFPGRHENASAVAARAALAEPAAASRHAGSDAAVASGRAGVSWRGLEAAKPAREPRPGKPRGKASAKRASDEAAAPPVTGAQPPGQARARGGRGTGNGNGHTRARTGNASGGARGRANAKQGSSAPASRPVRAKPLQPPGQAKKSPAATPKPEPKPPLPPGPPQPPRNDGGKK